VSCSAQDACTSVGTSAGGPTGNGPLIERWNGTNWSTQPAPNPVGTNSSFLSAISCPTVNACTAAGYDFPSSGPEPIAPLLESWDGTRWSMPATPNPKNAVNALLFGVTCAAGLGCSAVGTYSVSGGPNGGGPSLTLLEHSNGGGWSIHKAVDPP